MLSTMEIRSAVLGDLSGLDDLRLERRVILSQFDPRVTVNQSEHDMWLMRMKERITDTASAVLVAEEGNDLQGYIVGCILFVPRSEPASRYGIVEEIVLDVHAYHGGLARLLYSTLSKWFSKSKVEQVLIRTLSGYAVEQAFWRGLGATVWKPPAREITAWKTAPEHIWLKL
jgi:hypothetical protein